MIIEPPFDYLTAMRRYSAAKYEYSDAETWLKERKADFIAQAEKIAAKNGVVPGQKIKYLNRNGIVREISLVNRNEEWIICVTIISDPELRILDFISLQEFVENRK